MTDTLPQTPDKTAAAISEIGERIIERIKMVYDPEIPVNIYDMGLIYKIDVTPNDDDTFDVRVEMTLTTPNCPVAGQMPSMVKQAVSGAEKTRDVTVILVWDPPWEQSRMSDEARMQLNMF